MPCSAPTKTPGRHVFSAADGRRRGIGAVGRADVPAAADIEPIEPELAAQPIEHSRPAARHGPGREGELQALGGRQMARIRSEQHPGENLVLGQLRGRGQRQLGRGQAAGERCLGRDAIGRVFRQQVDPGLIEGAGGKADGAAADDEILPQKIERSPHDVEPAADGGRVARPRHHQLAPPFAVEPMTAHERLARYVHLHIQGDEQPRRQPAFSAPPRRERRRCARDRGCRSRRH